MPKLAPVSMRDRAHRKGQRMQASILAASKRDDAILQDGAWMHSDVVGVKHGVCPLYVDMLFRAKRRVG